MPFGAYWTTPDNEPVCPARDFGRIAACRTCKFTGGGASAVCIEMRRMYEAGRKIERLEARVAELSAALGAE